MASFPAEPITLSVGQQSPGAPPVQPPRRAPGSPLAFPAERSLSGHRGCVRATHRVRAGADTVLQLQMVTAGFRRECSL